MFKRLNKLSDNINYILVGLGNPGNQYDFTRHNIGFMAIDYIAQKCNVKLKKTKFKSLCATTKINENKIFLMKPSTFMNLSGNAVIEAMTFYKISPEKVIVLLDDINLPPGKIRIRKKGSDGGHNGIRNIIYTSGSDDFPRIKIGVGNKPDSNWDLADWVLSHFSEEEMKQINVAIDNVYESINLIIKNKIIIAMNEFNS